MTRSTPLIAVPAYPRLAPDRVEGWHHGGLGIPLRYVDALHAAGAREAVFEPVVGPDADADALLARFDGLLLLGGGDLDPATYGQAPSTTVYGVDADRDAAELALTRAAQRRGLPLLAICRGHQVVNVAAGGTLLQHITDTPGVGDHGRPGTRGGAALQAVTVEPGTRLAAALGGTTVVGSCHHHQAVDRVGDDLRVVARAVDGVVEALEPADPAAPWLVSVQWHPEDTAGDADPAGRANAALFAAFVTACRAARGQSE